MTKRNLIDRTIASTDRGAGELHEDDKLYLERLIAANPDQLVWLMFSDLTGKAEGLAELRSTVAPDLTDHRVYFRNLLRHALEIDETYDEARNAREAERRALTEAAGLTIDGDIPW